MRSNIHPHQFLYTETMNPIDFEYTKQEEMAIKHWWRLQRAIFGFKAGKRHCKTLDNTKNFL